jgi:ubiquitin thioesterase OTU1
MENNLNIRLAWECGNLVLTCKESITIEELRKMIRDEIQRSERKTFVLDEMIVKLGFPPKSIGKENDKMTLKEMKISNNESLRLEIKNIKQISGNAPTNKNTDSNSDQIDYSKYSLYRKIINADNSCLFNAVNYAINNCINEPEIMRELIAVEIQTNPDFYDEAILEKDPMEYCSWIMQNDTWGGGVELSILSKFFQIQIAVADIKTSNFQYFGEVRDF